MSAAAPEAETFQHFRILRREDGSLWKLGEGGMGATYKAIDSNLGVAVALKLIRADLLNRDPSARTRFIREAKAAASLRHRHVATVYHLGDDGQNYFYAMEFVDGETLEERVKRLGPLPVEKVLALALQASRALIAAHKVGLVHRDLKPANLMLVDEADEDDVLKLIDFGLAKSNAAGVSGADYKITQTGFSAGFSPGYASPEQCQYLDADIRSDIYSLGVTLWFVLSGDLPFKPTTGKPLEAQVFELQSKHVHAPPPLEKLEAVGVPAPARELLARMLAKDPADRPQTPADLRKEIEACQRAVLSSNEAVSTPAPPAPPPSPYSFDLEALLRQRGSLNWNDLLPLLAPLAALADDLAASEAAALTSFCPR
ncbi:MAG: serine/threonine protein kinase, partial [Verrucomicrobia bacterium]|nr:serine/threonine protein kinase [Verrucomicrobiota bacterium]